MKKFTLRILHYSLALGLLISCTNSKPKKIKKKDKEPEQIEYIPNSLAEYYKNSKVKYSYIPETQTHDYSNNWDFDGDGKKDSIRFVGDGGAHLNYSLVTHLSSSSNPEYFDWIYTDNPRLVSINELPPKSTEFVYSRFIVHDFNNDNIKDIFIKVDNYGQKLPDKFEKLGLKNREIILSFDKKSSSFIVHQWRDL